MTKEEAITYLEDAKHNLPYKFEQAIDMAIEALQREEAEEKGYCHRIKPKEYFKNDAMQKLREMPRYLNGVKEKQIKKISADAEPKWNCTANFVAEHLDKLKDMSVSEKLKLIQDLLGVEFKEENLNYKHTSAEADRPSGEWTYLHGSIGSYMTISCPICGSTFDDVAEWKYHFCPNCGAKMNKGGDTE